VIAIDTETTGLDCRTHELTTVGGSFGTDPFVLRHPEDRDLIQGILDVEDTFVGHNTSFDMHFLEAAGYRIPPPEKWIDTILVAHVAGERKRVGLSYLQAKLVEMGKLPAEILEPEERINQWVRAAKREARKTGARPPEKGDAPASILDPYLSADIVSTRAVANHWGSLVNGQADILELERRCIPAVYAAERRGVPLDIDGARELRDGNELRVEDLEADLFELAGHEFNPNSARQFEIALTKRDVDVSDLPRTPKTGNLVLRTETIEAIEDELAATWLDWRSEEMLRRYIKNLWKFAHGDRLYGTFRQCGSETGRMSSAKPNLQNIPKNTLAVRYCVCAGEGKVLVAADLDNAELRTLAAFAGDGELQRAFARGADIHQETANALGISRDEGKTLNFATIYGAGSGLIAERLHCTKLQARRILDRWFEQYPEVAQLRSRLRRTVQRQGYLESIGGRHHFWPEGPNHTLLNRLVSGSCADMFKLAAIALHDAGVETVLYVHDEVVAEVDEDRAEDTAALLAEILPRPMKRGDAEVDCLVAKAEIHKRWSDFKQPEYSPWATK
jgi:DNA polymerase I-like protein with 3'-5' exonuclease and polymerase domains